MTVIFQAYGREEIYQQTKMSVVSLLKLATNINDLKIIIYSDQPEVFQSFFAGQGSVTTSLLTSEQIIVWQGKPAFVHRLKIEMLIDAAKKNPGPLVYCDSDTIFTGDVSTVFHWISDHVSVMHTTETVIEQGKDPLSKKMAKFLRRTELKFAGREIRISPSLTMYNAGVIGISEKNKQLLPQVLELTDALYSLYQKHVMEQLSVSYFLQSFTAVRTSEDLVIHYWNQKDLYQKNIDQYLQANSDSNSALANFNTFKIVDAPKNNKGGFRRLVNTLKTRFSELSR